MQLEEVLPRQSLISALNWSLSFEDYGLSEIDRVVELKPDSMFEIGAAIWDRHVRLNQRAVNPRALADSFDSSNPVIFREIEDLIGASVISDLYYVHATVDDL